MSRMYSPFCLPPTIRLSVVLHPLKRCMDNEADKISSPLTSECGPSKREKSIHQLPSSPIVVLVDQTRNKNINVSQQPVAGEDDSMENKTSRVGIRTSRRSSNKEQYKKLSSPFNSLIASVSTPARLVS